MNPEPRVSMIKKTISSLTFWVLLAILLGAALGWFSPTLAKQTKPLAEWFIQVVKVFIYPLVFLTVSLGIASMSDLRSVGKIGLKSIIYFEIVTTFALLIGIVVAYAVQPGRGLKPIESADISKYADRQADLTLSHFLWTNHTLQVLAAAIIVGFLLSILDSKKFVSSFLSQILSIVFGLLKWVMRLAPVAAFAGMATTIGEYGVEVLLSLIHLMLTVYCTMALFIFVVLQAILRYYRISLVRFLYFIREELLLVLGTSSSEAALPQLMQKLERFGCSKPVVGLVIPAGYSFNLDGTTIYLSLATIFLSQVYQVELSWQQLLTVIGVLMVTSKGAAGVTGAGFVVLASTLEVLQVIPIVGMSILMGVDRFMSEARSITNFIGNGVAAIALACHEDEFDRAKYSHVLQMPPDSSRGNQIRS